MAFGTITGTILDDTGAPCERHVRAYRRDTGALVASHLSAADTSFSSVGLLLHADGENNATTISDSSGSPKTITAVGNAKLSTAQAKFGVSSMLFDGNGDCFTAPSGDSWDFGTGDFTIEGFVFPTNAAATGNQGIIVRDAIGGTRGWLLFLADGTSGSTLRGLSFAAWSGATVASAQSASVPTANAWTHFAATRESGVFKLWLGGTLVATQSGFTGLSVGSSGTPLCVGSLYGTSSPFASSGIQGHLDEVRVTKGVARYTAAFTPPAYAFPESASAGSYRLVTPTLDEVQRIVLDDSGGTLYNDLIDRVIPA